MDITPYTPFIGGAAVLLVAVTGLGMMVAKFYRKVDQGQALIVNTRQRRRR